MNLYIPPLGSQLVLAKDWEFLLHPEQRNESLFEFLGNFKEQPIYFRHKPTTGPYDRTTRTFRPMTVEEERIWAPKQVSLPKGTLLQVDRIYIRKGLDDFDSITFTLPGQKVQIDGTTIRKTVRFWVKLEDANRIVFDERN